MSAGEAGRGGREGGRREGNESWGGREGRERK